MIKNVLPSYYSFTFLALTSALSLTYTLGLFHTVRFSYASLYTERKSLKKETNTFLSRPILRAVKGVEDQDDSFGMIHT